MKWEKNAFFGYEEVKALYDPTKTEIVDYKDRRHSKFGYEYKIVCGKVLIRLPNTKTFKRNPLKGTQCKFEGSKLLVKYPHSDHFIEYI